MKQFAILLLSTISIFSLSAEERNIELYEQVHKKELRSISYVPTITYDNNSLQIYSEIPLENLQVLVTDLSSGTTFCYNNIIVANNLPYRLELQNIEVGNYKLEVNFNKKSYYSYFEITL